MRKLSILCAAAAITVTAFAAASPAQAAYHLIKWEGTGFCQIWDENIPSQPFPSNYTRVSTSPPTLLDAISVKDGMIRAGACAF